MYLLFIDWVIAVPYFTSSTQTQGFALLVISKVCICIVMPCWSDYRAQYDVMEGNGHYWQIFVKVWVAKILNEILCVLWWAGLFSGRQADNYSISANI